MANRKTERFFFRIETVFVYYKFFSVKSAGNIDFGYCSCKMKSLDKNKQYWILTNILMMIVIDCSYVGIV